MIFRLQFQPSNKVIMLNTSVHIGSLKIKNPITVASGTAGYGEELSMFMDISRLGAIFTKGLSLEPRAGNMSPRIVETPSGILNSIGLQNVGIEEFLNEKLPFLLKKGATVIPNIAGRTIDENVELCRILTNTEGIDAVELNVSCPNVKEGGIAFGRELSVFTKLIQKVRKFCNSVLIIKLSPNVSDITDFAYAAKEMGADAISVVNTILAMKIDIKKGVPYFKGKVAGLSGPAIKPIAVRMVYEIFERVDIPIIGMGGICNINDILEFMMAGATAISLGTINLVNPVAAIECIEKYEQYLISEKINNISELVGVAHRNTMPH